MSNPKKAAMAAWSREKREASGLSQRQVSTLSGLNMTDVERGKRVPSYELLEILGPIYGLSRQDWLEFWLQHEIPVSGKFKAAAVALAKAIRESPDAA